MNPATTPQQRPCIDVTDATAALLIPEVLTHIIESQKDAPRLFSQYGGLPVRLRDGGRGRVEVLDRHSLQLELDRAIEFVKEVRRDVVRIEPPLSIVQGILAADRYDDFPELPELRRVAEAPYFTRDGVLVDTMGYHAASRTFLRLPAELQGMASLPDRPTTQDVAAARGALVEDLFVDFPFATPSSCAHALALLITPFVREMLGSGPVPMAAIVAPTPGSGKSKLAHAVALVATGQPMAVMSATIHREEEEKRITALLLEGAPYGMFDNAVGKVDSPSLAALLTAEYWTGRRLGRSEMLGKLPNNTQWVVTGNLLEFTQEIARRSLTIALDPKRDDPYQRDTFKHHPLERWIKEARPMLVRSVLMLIRHWIAEGRPEFTARTLGSFESFARIVGGVLMAAGLDEGFLTPTIADDDNFFAAAPKDADADLRKLVEAWERSFGYTVRTARHLLEVAPTGLIASGDEINRRMKLGKYIQKHVGRIIAGHRIVADTVKDDEGRTRNAWRLVDVARASKEA